MAFGELFRHWTYRVFAPGALLRRKYEAFRELIQHDGRSLERIAEIEDIHYGSAHVDWTRVVALCDELEGDVMAMVARLREMNPLRWMDLADYASKVAFYARMAVSIPEPDLAPPYVLPLAAVAGRPEVAGHKAARLATVRERTMLPVPEGFVVTASAFHYVIEYNGLREQLDNLLRQVDLADGNMLVDMCRAMRELVLSVELPPQLETELIEAGRALSPDRAPLAVRSSAVAEDGEASFAGQHASVLGVAPADLPEAYRTVLASKYAPRAVSYRIIHGFADTETPMAVLLMPLVQAAASGVVYTRAPSPPARILALASTGRACKAEEPRTHPPLTPPMSPATAAAPATPEDIQDATPDGQPPLHDGPPSSTAAASPEERTPAADAAEQAGVIAIHAVGGLGTPLMDGSSADSTAWLSRSARHRILERAPGLPLTTEDLKRLARFATELESLFGEPQDVEWALDEEGRISIVQTRPIPGAAVRPAPQVDLSGMETLLAGADPVAPGTGCGTVVHVASCCDIGDLPPGTVLVTPCLGPSLARVLDRIEGVVSVEGSRASHFASVAREASIPVLVTGDDSLLSALSEGTLVTVDAQAGRVLAGCPAHPPPRRSTPGALAQRGPMHRLARAMPHVARLTLVDPASSDFAPANCRSLHDIVRFCHEMAVREMFSLVGHDGRGLSGARKVRGDIPVVMYVLNLDDGLFPSAIGKREITPDDFRSLPLWAVWFGLASNPAVWAAQPPPADWEELDRISGGIFRRDAPQLASYAVASSTYANVMLRFGYHFAVIDSLCADDTRANYIQFRLKGGGGHAEGRSLRLRFLSRVLESSGFATRMKGDLIDARHGPGSEALIQKRLALLGRVLAVTRLMDMRLTTEEQADTEADAFLEGLRPTEDDQ